MNRQCELIERLFSAAVESVSAQRCMPDRLPEPPRGRTVVVGAGKAAAEMARVVEARWQGALSGLVITRYGHGVPLNQIELVEAAHPIPDPRGQAAARRIIGLVREVGRDDLVLCLISGGGSALMAQPADGITLHDKQQVNRALLRSGATIAEINCVRKHLSAIKGGRLAAAAYPARVVSLLVSDVPGDDPSVIASGPTVADPTTFADARRVLARYQIDAPQAIVAHLDAEREETPKPGDARLADCRTSIIATAQVALDAAADDAERAGYTAQILGNAIEGEARDVARGQAAIARHVASHGRPYRPPCVLLSGGETTVTVRGQGRGGRNVEFLLALAIALDGQAGIHAIACDTDGIDGTEDNAGAIITPDTLQRAAHLGLDARAMLARNDAYSFFAALDDLVVTGPTRTNVNDFRAILIDPHG